MAEKVRILSMQKVARFYVVDVKFGDYEARLGHYDIDALGIYLRDKIVEYTGIQVDKYGLEIVFESDPAKLHYYEPAPGVTSIFPSALFGKMKSPDEDLSELLSGGFGNE